MISVFSNLSNKQKQYSLIADNYLSCILDGNGQGFDFQILGSVSEINTHLVSILTTNERQAIVISIV